MILIAGPCVVENRDILEETVETILESINTMTNIDFYFKSSFKKDNRTLPSKFQSIGDREAVNLLIDVKKKYNVKICTDFHLPDQIERFGEEIDLIQIPAYLARQNSLLTKAFDYARQHNKKVSIKKPQFAGPEDCYRILEFNRGEDENIFIIDRGTQLGYDKVFMDPRHIIILQDSFRNVLVDITHPQKNYQLTVGNSYLAEILGVSCMAVGGNGVFLETHPDPRSALCDRDTQLPLEVFSSTIKRIYRMRV